MNWLDWLFVILIVLSAIRGLKAGLLAGVTGIAGLLCGIWAAVNYHGYLEDFLSTKWNWDKKISNLLFTYISQNCQDNSNIGGHQGESVLDTIISPGDILNIGLQTIQPVANSILNVIAFCFIVVVVYIIAGIILRIISRTVAGTILSPFDKLGGLLLGVVKGGIFAAVVLVFLLTLRAPFSILSNYEGAAFLTLAIQKSQITPLLLNLINSLNLPLPVLKTGIL